jgi:hypothetical protein
LVEQQIADGQRLIERLVQEGFPVAAACWVKESDGGPWYLYLASPIVDTRGTWEAYRRILRLIRQMPQPFWIGSLETKAIKTTDRVGKYVLDLYKSHGHRRPIRFSGSLLGNVAVDGVYIYPPEALKAPEPKPKETPTA